MRTLELLAPAKNLECGIAAIDHGADAVYIGAPRFGARAAAGNSLDDISQLCAYAHQFGAKVHVTVNTIIYDSEFDDTIKMIRELQRVGVDAVLLQDMGVMNELMKEQSVADSSDSSEKSNAFQLHASTQCDTRSAEKVRWLQGLGFQRAVLARELSVEEIRKIHDEVPTMDLEVFVHGALCVSYSGVCYASEHCFHRSANRGECAQFCRLKFDLKDVDGKVIEQGRHLLSLKDLCQIDHLEELADAGACSFKIEGRLKDAGYVKNVVSAYSQRLDEIVARRPNDYQRASHGRVEYSFAPDLKKTFNRGFTTYFLHSRQPNIFSPDTPKAIGEYVGKVKELRGNSFNVAGTAAFMNGDGLCFLNHDHELEGFRVNRAEGNRLFPLKMPAHLKPGMALYRNNDVAFEKLLSGKTAVRKLPINISFRPVEGGFEATATEGCFKAKTSAVSAFVSFDHQQAQKPQGENIQRQLSKLGNTPYVCEEVDILDGGEQYFVPSSLLAELRRQLVEKLQATASDISVSESDTPVSASARSSASDNSVKAWQPIYNKYAYIYNIANNHARSFYAAHGLPAAEMAFELRGKGRGVAPQGADAGKGALLMQCRHCLRFALGYCVKRGGVKPTWREPLTLHSLDGRDFLLEFDCRECQMNVFEKLKN